jgi:hypothetical protein
VETRVELDLDHITREYHHNRRALKQTLAAAPDDRFGVRFQFPRLKPGGVAELVGFSLAKV